MLTHCDLAAIRACGIGSKAAYRILTKLSDDENRIQIRQVYEIKANQFEKEPIDFICD